MTFRSAIGGLLGLVLAAMTCAPGARAAIPILLSTDTGNEIDDQYVLLHALIDPAFRVVGIVSAHSPAESIAPPAAQHSTTAIRQIVEDRMRLRRHPPIVTGSDLPLPDERTARDTKGARFLIAQSRGYGPRRRLRVVTTGAATDVASALLLDPGLADRMEIVAMGFHSWKEGGREFNIKNDPAAWRVILRSRVPVVIGDWAVTYRDLAFSRPEVATLLSGGGKLADWLLRDYDGWYEAFAKSAPEFRRADGTPFWVIWDEVTLAYLLGLAKAEQRPRPDMAADLSFTPGAAGTIGWITSVDRPALVARYSRLLRAFVARHPTRDMPCVTFGRSPTACWRQGD